MVKVTFDGLTFDHNTSFKYLDVFSLDKRLYNSIH